LVAPEKRSPSTIAVQYRDFLADVLQSAERWGPHNPAVVRRIELGTERYLLRPARELEASGMPAEELEAHRREVRDALRPIWARGPFGYEITHWPAGPGSARAMELVYNNNPPPHNVQGHYTDWYLLTRDLGHAVRSRRDTLRDFILAELNAKPEADSVLDLACGPMQSLREALPFLHEPKRLRLTALDTDELAQINNRAFFRRDHSLPWDLEVANVLETDFGVGKQDLVYSTGLYDYLPSPILARLWKRVYASLKPGGVAVLSVKDGAKFCPLIYRWLVDWSQFFIRTEADFEGIMKSAKLPAPESVLRDATGCIIFYMIRKPA
ncbi:MAG TPA: class I SAM-dependent methyltransferase, partial [Polyangiales bacterium]